MTIVVCAYDHTWPLRFAQLAQPIQQALAGFHAITIEHVGSTAVPGLAAKPIIDMDIVVQHSSDIPGIIATLAPLGYEHRGDLGIVGREAFTRPADMFPHNLYLGLASAPSMRNHLLLRDYLRQHPQAVLAYGKLKQQLAQQYPDDIDAYVAGKSQFIADILTAQGMDAQHVADIQQQNRA
ncbi:MAG: hypothetical protein RL076_2153 [Chloroflexota bacterium]|jgi:GrpB-like predicted nucleotidyltransferase (UPF0157 family)